MILAKRLFYSVIAVAMGVSAIIIFSSIYHLRTYARDDPRFNVTVETDMLVFANMFVTCGLMFAVWWNRGFRKVRRNLLIIIAMHIIPLFVIPIYVTANEAAKASKIALPQDKKVMDIFLDGISCQLSIMLSMGYLTVLYVLLGHMDSYERAGIEDLQESHPLT